MLPFYLAFVFARLDFIFSVQVHKRMIYLTRSLVQFVTILRMRLSFSHVGSLRTQLPSLGSYLVRGMGLVFGLCR